MSNHLEEVAQEVVKKRRTRPDSAVQAEPGDNTRFLRHNIMLSNLPSINMTDKAAVSERISQYFEICVQNDMKPSVEGLAVAFGIDRVTLWKHVNGGTKSIPSEVVNTLKKAYGVLNAQMADYMQNGKINPVAGIFLMKNNMAYRDETEVVITPNTVMGEAQEADVIAERYKLLPAEDDQGSN